MDEEQLRSLTELLLDGYSAEGTLRLIHRGASDGGATAGPRGCLGLDSERALCAGAVRAQRNRGGAPLACARPPGRLVPCAGHGYGDREGPIGLRGDMD
jgi:hypothetical protein